MKTINIFLIIIAVLAIILLIYFSFKKINKNVSTCFDCLLTDTERAKFVSDVKVVNNNFFPLQKDVAKYKNLWKFQDNTSFSYNKNSNKLSPFSHQFYIYKEEVEGEEGEETYVIENITNYRIGDATYDNNKKVFTLNFLTSTQQNADLNNQAILTFSLNCKDVTNEIFTANLTSIKSLSGSDLTNNEENDVGKAFTFFKYTCNNLTNKGTGKNESGNACLMFNEEICNDEGKCVKGKIPTSTA
jgi:hypothetical protein